MIIISDANEYTMQVAGASMVASFFCEVLKEMCICEHVFDKLIDKEKDSRFHTFIQMQDRSIGLF